MRCSLGTGTGSGWESRDTHSGKDTGTGSGRTRGLAQASDTEPDTGQGHGDWLSSDTEDPGTGGFGDVHGGGCLRSRSSGQISVLPPHEELPDATTSFIAHHRHLLGPSLLAGLRERPERRSLTRGPRVNGAVRCRVASQFFRAVFFY
ncbi:hypothetical protein DPEC_G00367250 [Dallia pectoralis]|nr:hypothetical protein DPEC_G00367250 [Dallia pectoralis]